MASRVGGGARGSGVAAQGGGGGGGGGGVGGGGARRAGGGGGVEPGAEGGAGGVVGGGEGLGEGFERGGHVVSGGCGLLLRRRSGFRASFIPYILSRLGVIGIPGRRRSRFALLPPPAACRPPAAHQCRSRRTPGPLLRSLDRTSRSRCASTARPCRRSP